MLRFSSKAAQVDAENVVLRRSGHIRRRETHHRILIKVLAGIMAAAIDHRANVRAPGALNRKGGVVAVRQHANRDHGEEL